MKKAQMVCLSLQYFWVLFFSLKLLVILYEMVPCGSNCSYGMSSQASRQPHNNSLSEYKLGLQAYSFIQTIMRILLSDNHIALAFR